jgi:hypothetical protein
MNSWGQTTDFSSLIPASGSGNSPYANTVKAETDQLGSNYQENSKKIKRPHNKPRDSFITLPRPKSVIPNRY